MRLGSGEGSTMKNFIVCNIIRIIKSRRFRLAGHASRMEVGRNGFKILTGIPSGKKTLGTPRHKWDENIRMDLKK